MTAVPDATSTRPYLIRALYEWCTDNGFTPYLAVSVNDSVQVPREYVKDCEIVLNVSFDATSSLILGNDFIEFKGRFAGAARDILVPVSQVIAIYARENGQGMVFPLEPAKDADPAASSSKNLVSLRDATQATTDVKLIQVVSVDAEHLKDESDDEPDPPKSSSPGLRPVLKRVK